MPALGVALITGATDGIGLHTARRCVERGRDVVVHGRDLHRVERAIEAVEARGQRVRLLYCQPIWHNPTGVCISKARAETLLQVCAKHSVVAPRTGTARSAAAPRS